MADAAAGLLCLAARLHDEPERLACDYDFGPAPGEPETSVGELVRRLFALWTGEPHAGPPVAADDEDRYGLDDPRVGADLGWRPLWSLDEALSSTVEWYRGHAAGAHARQLTEAQVARHAATAAARSPS